MNKLFEGLSTVATPWYMFFAGFGTLCFHDMLYINAGKPGAILVSSFYPLACFIMLIVMHGMKTLIKLHKEQAEDFSKIAENAIKELNDVLLDERKR